MKAKSKKKKIILIVLIVLLLLNIADFIFSLHIYKENFDQRFTSSGFLPKVEDFEGLKAERHEFTSDKGQTLVGYTYSCGDGADKAKGVLVMAHGLGGGGHIHYLSVADWFARRGYTVFAYDATGNDESGGDGVGGLAQGVIDLDHAISYAEELCPGMPVVLFGHSWGGYSVMNVLKYHPEVKAVAECSGFATSSDMFEIEGKNQAGYAIYAMLPYVKLIDRIRFGGYAKNNAFDAFEASDTPVMVIHSADDQVVPIEYGYDKIYEKYSGDPRFEFVRFEDTGHNEVFESKEKRDVLNGKYKEWLDTRGYDYEAPENAERFNEDHDYYMNNIMDKKEWNNLLNDELFEQIEAFYSRNLAG